MDTSSILLLLYLFLIVALIFTGLFADISPIKPSTVCFLLIVTDCMQVANVIIKLNFHMISGETAVVAIILYAICCAIWIVQFLKFKDKGY